MDMFNRKYMFGDKSTFCIWLKHAQKRPTRKIFICTFNQGKLPIFKCKNTFTLYNARF